MENLIEYPGYYRGNRSEKLFPGHLNPPVLLLLYNQLIYNAEVQFRRDWKADNFPIRGPSSLSL